MRWFLTVSLLLLMCGSAAAQTEIVIRRPYLVPRRVATYPSTVPIITVGPAIPYPILPVAPPVVVPRHHYRYYPGFLPIR